MTARPRAVLVLLVATLVAGAAAVATWHGDRASTPGSALGPAAASTTTSTAASTTATTAPASPEVAGPDRCRGVLLEAGLAAGLVRRDGGPLTLPTVARGVEEVRRLRFRHLPTPTFLPAAEVAERAAGFVDDYPPEREALDEAALVALGALPRGTDLRATLRRALGEQVVGFYDDDSGELVVASDTGDRLDAETALVLAHELEHALADQAFELPGGDTPRPGREDKDAAASALVEGDATLTMQLWALRSLSPGDMAGLGAGPAFDAAFAALPDFVQRSLLFPYTEGLGFVCARYGAGGWTAVDAAYRDPPRSTAEILFPDRYERREAPTVLPEPAGPGPGWAYLGHAAVGAADLLFLFEAPGGDRSRALDRPRARAGAWAGGRADVWAQGERRTVVVTLAQRPGALSLCESMKAFTARARLRATARCAGGTVGLALASTV